MIDLIALINLIASNVLLLILILCVIVILKGMALYRAARKGSVTLFWIILIFNTLGILPLLYLIFTRRER